MRKTFQFTNILNFFVYHPTKKTLPFFVEVFKYSTVIILFKYTRSSYSYLFKRIAFSRKSKHSFTYHIVLIINISIYSLTNSHFFYLEIVWCDTHNSFSIYIYFFYLKRVDTLSVIMQIIAF